MHLVASKARVAHFVRVINREGFVAVGRRQTRRAIDDLTERLRIGWLAFRSWTPDRRPVFLMISHHCGGGTERHVTDMASSLRSAGVRPIFVRPSGSGHVLWEERDDDGRATWCRRSTSEAAAIGRVLSILQPIHAHVHHMMGLPDDIIELLRGRGVSYDWTIHDYYSICPRVNLIGAGGYCGEPDAAACDRCLTQLGDDQGRPVRSSIASWRERHRHLLAGARRVFAPSEDVRRRLARYYPELRVLVRPHLEALPELEKSLAVRLEPGERVRVAVLGTIVAVKGSEQLLACAGDADSRELPLEFHVIGSTDRDAVFARMKNVRVAGRYRERDVYERLARARCHLALLPSLCPESFMYTLSVAMAARLFVFCFDLGAQAERVRGWGWGRALAIETSPGAINDALVATARSLADGPPAPPPPRSAFYPDILTSYYDFTAAEIEALERSPRALDRLVGPTPSVRQRRDHARLH